MDSTFFAGYESQSHSFNVKCSLMHGNAPSQVSKLIHEYFEYKRFIGEKIMELLLSSPDLNPIENLWSIVK